jgi:hypothetical protein
MLQKMYWVGDVLWCPISWCLHYDRMHFPLLWMAIKVVNYGIYACEKPRIGVKLMYNMYFRKIMHHHTLYNIFVHMLYFDRDHLLYLSCEIQDDAKDVAMRWFYYQSEELSLMPLVGLPPFHLNLGLLIILIFGYRLLYVYFLYCIICIVVMILSWEINVYTHFHVLWSVWFGLNIHCCKTIYKMRHLIQIVVFEKCFCKIIYTLWF